MTEQTLMSAVELARCIRDGTCSSTEVTQSFARQVERLDPALNALPTRDLDAAIEAGRRADAALSAGHAPGPLHGVPITLKDSHAVAGLRSTIGVAGQGDRVPESDGTVARRLRAAGAIILGKSNVSQRLYDVQAVNELFGRTNNPWDVTRTPGGSSGGAAAAVAAGLSAGDVGSDLGGSIRIPAAFCGVVGFKPTEGRIPETGHIDVGLPRSVWIMESISPIGRTVEDVELLFSVLAGPDGDDWTVPPVPFRPEEPPVPAGLRVAVSTGFSGVRVQAAIRDAVRDTADSLARLGARVEEALPDVDWDAQRETRNALFRLTDTVFAPDADPAEFRLGDYLAALDRRGRFIAAWEQFFDAWDVLLTPATNRTAFEHRPMGTPYEVDGETVPYWAIEPHVQPMNFIGAPAIVLPAGLDEDGLPIGVQLTAGRWRDERLLAIARLVEGVTGGYRPPALAGTEAPGAATR